jgi:hypothetical protein
VVPCGAFLLEDGKGSELALRAAVAEEMKREEKGREGDSTGQRISEDWAVCVLAAVERSRSELLEAFCIAVHGIL